jgi:hypothetical protein
MPNKTKFGRIYDAAKQTPPHGEEILIFHDEVFAWGIGVYDSKKKASHFALA